MLPRNGIMDTTFPTTRSWHLDESKKVLRLMQELGIQAVVRRKRRSKVTTRLLNA